MKAMHAREVSELVTTSAFLDWYRKNSSLHEELEQIRSRHRRLYQEMRLASDEIEVLQQTSDDLVFRAGECDDLSARAAAEYSDIENNSFELLSAFEGQRRATTEAWEAYSRTEKLLEDHRQIANDVRTKLEALKKGGTQGSAGEVDRLSTELADLENRITAYSREVDAGKRKFDEENKRRDELWREVESTWSAAFRANMARSEYAYQARRVRGRTSMALAQLGSLRERVRSLTDEGERLAARIAELEAGVASHLQSARSQFQCALIEEFLIWPSEEDVHSALCVPLIDEREHLNIQVMALQVYKVDRARGLDFIEPVVERVEGAEDPRLGSFFDRVAAD